MKTIKAKSASEAWLNTSKYLLEKGQKLGNIIEKRNVAIEIRRFWSDKKFDKKFREIFGDERIDYAKRVTFMEPEKQGFVDNVYVSLTDTGEAKDSYWDRMIRWRGEFNQIENAIKLLSKHQNIKRCELIIYDPLRDAKQMFKQPCLLTIDLKPRNGRLHLTAFFRSQRVSKSGYADYTALIELGQYLSDKSGIKLHSVTCIAASCHLATGEELRNTKKLLENMR